MLESRVARPIALLVAAVGLNACASTQDAPRSEPKPTPAATPAPRAEPTPAPVTLKGVGDSEHTPVPAATARVLESYVTGGLDGEQAARTLDHQLAERLDPPARVKSTGLQPAPLDPLVDGTRGWTISARRALVLAIQRSPDELREKIRTLQDPLAIVAANEGKADLAQGKLSHALLVADRFPCAPFAAEVADTVADLRHSGPHEVLDLTSLAGPMNGGPLSFEGIRVQADGPEGLVAMDVDNNRVWEYRLPACEKGDEHWIRVLGAVRERIIILVGPHTGSPAFCLGLQATTGNELFRAEIFPITREVADKLEPVDTALGPLEVVVAAKGKVACVDVRRGELAWMRTGLTSGRLSSVGTERVSLASPTGEGPGLELDLVTGRRIIAPVAAPERPKQGTIEIK